MNENNWNIQQKTSEKEKETKRQKPKINSLTPRKTFKANDYFNKNLTLPKKFTSEKKLNKNKQLIGEYQIIKTIGKGTFSRVKLGIHIITKKKVAIKILDKSKIVEKDDFIRIIREICILSKIDHPNIINVYQIS